MKSHIISGKQLHVDKPNIHKVELFRLPRSKYYLSVESKKGPDLKKNFKYCSSELHLACLRKYINIQLKYLSFRN